MPHWLPHVSEGLLTQILIIAGLVIQGWNQYRAHKWETEDRKMRAKAAQERDEITKGLDRNTRLTAQNTELTLATAQQVAETHNLTLKEMLEKANAGWAALRHRHQVEENAGAEAEGRPGPAG